MDTPGFHKARTRLGDFMVDVVRQSVADVDVVLLLVEPIANIGTQERLLLEQLKAENMPQSSSLIKLIRWRRRRSSLRSSPNTRLQRGYGL